MRLKVNAMRVIGDATNCQNLFTAQHATSIALNFVLISHTINADSAISESKVAYCIAYQLLYMHMSLPSSEPILLQRTYELIVNLAVIYPVLSSRRDAVHIALLNVILRI